MSKAKFKAYAPQARKDCIANVTPASIKLDFHHRYCAYKTGFY